VQRHSLFFLRIPLLRQILAASVIFSYEWRKWCIFAIIYHFLISEIGAGATEMPKVSNIQMWNVKVNFDKKNCHEEHGLLNCNAV
jgi:hypothetical protein